MGSVKFPLQSLFSKIYQYPWRLLRPFRTFEAISKEKKQPKNKTEINLEIKITENQLKVAFQCDCGDYSTLLCKHITNFIKIYHLLKRDSNTGIFQICEIFKSTCFYRTPLVAASPNSSGHRIIFK